MEEPDLLTISSTPPRLRYLARYLGLSNTAFERAMQLAGLTPGPTDWQQFLERLFLLSGVALLVVGILSFFAFNWAQLSYYAKLALPQLLMVACVVLVALRGLSSAGSKAALVAAAVFAGAALAMYGQTYQTGADPYGLFVGWAVLILLWTLIGRSPGLWLLFMLLLNLALILYWAQVLHPPRWESWRMAGPLGWIFERLFDFGLAQWLFLLNAVAVVFWESIALRGSEWLQSRYLPRLLGLVALLLILVNVLSLVFSRHDEIGTRFSWLSPLLYVVITLTGLWFYQFKRRDLLILTLLCLGVVVVLTSLFLSFIFKQEDIFFDHNWMGTVLLIALVIIGEIVAVVYWLRKVRLQWRESAV
jgi:uncharacterized membrane protein